MIDIAVILFGLIIGSFLTVCVYRIPLGRASGIEELIEEHSEEEDANDGEDDTVLLNSPHFTQPVTIAFPPRSFCPYCGAQLRWYHNIPFFSYLFLRGKCAFCREGISFQYPLIELLSAFFAWLSYSTFDTPTALVAYALCAAFIVLSFIDIAYFLLPNVITYPAALIGLLIALIQGYFPFIESPPFVSGIDEALIGILGGAGSLLLISLFYTYVRKKQGLGLGDVKLLAVTGAFFGINGAFYTIFVGSLLGSLLGITLLLFGRGKWSSYLPFGPYLVAANLLYLFYAERFGLLMEELAVQQMGGG